MLQHHGALVATALRSVGLERPTGFVNPWAELEDSNYLTLQKSRLSKSQTAKLNGGRMASMQLRVMQSCNWRRKAWVGPVLDVMIAEERTRPNAVSAMHRFDSLNSACIGIKLKSFTCKKGYGRRGIPTSSGRVSPKFAAR
mmetsp:Transcript_107659/g.309896  ORF Transcript_107659/g.309896 Transcript_107659/m.309896 type:complete len:141 (-) Transcript_107659:57-479(-)